MTSVISYSPRAGGLQAACDLHDVVVVEVQARDRVVGSRLLRLLLDGDRPPGLVELDHAVRGRVRHPVGEHRPAVEVAEALQPGAEAGPVEQVVAEHQGDGVVADVVGAEHERLGEPVRSLLHRVADRDPEPRAVAEQARERVGVLRCGDEQDVSDPCEHQGRERVVDHRFVVDRRQLLADAQRDGVQSRPRAPGQNDSAHHTSVPALATGGARGWLTSSNRPVRLRRFCSRNGHDSSQNRGVFPQKVAVQGDSGVCWCSCREHVNADGSLDLRAPSSKARFAVGHRVIGGRDGDAGRRAAIRCTRHHPTNSQRGRAVGGGEPERSRARRPERCTRYAATSCDPPWWSCR